MNVLKNLREEARLRPNSDHLREAADKLDVALRAVAADPTEETVRSFNGYWAKAWRLLWALPPRENPEGGARMRRAA